MVQQQQHISSTHSEDGRDSKSACEASASEVQQLKAELQAALTRLRDAGTHLRSLTWQVQE